MRERDNAAWTDYDTVLSAGRDCVCHAERRRKKNDERPQQERRHRSQHTALNACRREFAALPRKPAECQKRYVSRQLWSTSRKAFASVALGVSFSESREMYEGTALLSAVGADYSSG